MFAISLEIAAASIALFLANATLASSDRPFAYFDVMAGAAFNGSCSNIPAGKTAPRGRAANKVAMNGANAANINALALHSWARHNARDIRIQRLRMDLHAVGPEKSGVSPQSGLHALIPGIKRNFENTAGMVGQAREKSSCVHRLKHMASHSMPRQNRKGKNMALPEFNLRQLLEAGVHFGHQTHRWNPRMGEFIYGERNGIHIIDLTQTVPLLDAALNVIRETVAKGGRILFVGTKRQASVAIGEAASRSAQHYINNRWLGGTLTNWNTVSQSIKHLDRINETLKEDVEGLTKKERLKLERVRDKLEANLGGIREMGGTPDLLFIVDVKKEALAVAEANKLGIPVVGIVDSNCSPDGVDHIIPGNDDASRAIKLYCDLAARSALDGMSAQLGAAGIDIGGLDGEQSEPVLENAAEEQPGTEESQEEVQKTGDDVTGTSDKGNSEG